MLRAVIFDLDGTLVTLEHDFRRTRELVIRRLKERGIPESLLSAKEPVEVNKQRTVNHLRRHGSAPLYIGEILAEIEEIVRKQDRDAAARVKPARGALEALAHLKKRKLKLALFTYNNRETTTELLAKHGFSEFFEVVVTRNDTPNPKPNPDHLKAAITKLGITPDEAAVVTDGTADAGACRSLGVYCIGVAGGHAKPEELKAAGANETIESLELLPSVVAGLSFLADL